MTDLGERVAILRDEVLDMVEGGSEDTPAGAIFDAIVRALSAGGDAAGQDVTLHDAVARRLAWGDTEALVLAAAEQVYARLARAAQRALRDPDEEMAVLATAADVVAGTARIVALAAVARARRERAAVMREEAAQRRLRDALAEQEENLARLQHDADAQFE